MTASLDDAAFVEAMATRRSYLRDDVIEIDEDGVPHATPWINLEVVERDRLVELARDGLKLTHKDDSGHSIKMSAEEWIAHYRQRLADAEARVRESGEALASLFQLVEDGWLVRSTTNDAHFPSFATESARLVTVLKAVQDALARRTT